MATLNESPNGKAVKGRTRKTAPKVDLTAMVDLMFLLTTFFMLTTTLSQLNAADIAKPVDAEMLDAYPASRTMTILLGQNNKSALYMGTTEDATLKIVDLTNIQKHINAAKLAVARANYNDPAKHMIVIIKPCKTSKFKDFVDAVDEMKIADIKSYTIDDKHISTKEEEFMKANGI